MAQFKSDAEKKKWASLQNQAGLSLQNIAKGTATASDVQAVSTALNGLNRLAKEVFDQAISAAEVSAKKFEGQYAAIQENNLSAYELALNKALTEFAPDLVGQIKDVLELENLEQTDELEKTFGSKLTDIQNLLPDRKGDLLTTDDLLTAQDLLVDELSTRDDAKWELRSKSLIEQIADTFKTTLRDLATQIKAERRVSTPANVPQLGYAGAASPTWDVVDDQPRLLSQANSLVGGSRQMALANRSDVIDMQPNTRTQASTIKSPEGIAMSKATEDAITTAANDQTSLYKQLLDFLANPDGHKSGKEDTTEDKAEAVARSLKNLGRGSKTKKDKKSETSSWLKALGPALAAMILDPQLFSGLADSVQKILTWDNIKKTAVASWEYMKDQGKTIVDWIYDKLGLNKKVDQKEADSYKDHGGAKLTQSNIERLKDPKVQAELAKMDAGLKDKNPNARLPEAKDPGKHASWQSKIANLFGITLGDANVVKSDVAQATNNPSYYTSQSTNVNASANTSVGGNRASVTNNNTDASSISKSTVSNPGTTIKVSPGTSTPPPGATAPSAPAGTGSSAPGKGAPQIGMSSFNFHSSIDDSLPLMNSTFLTH